MRVAVLVLRPRLFADFLIFSYIRWFLAPFTPRGGMMKPPQRGTSKNAAAERGSRSRRARSADGLAAGEEAVHAPGDVSEIRRVAAADLRGDEPVVLDVVERFPHFQPVDIAFAD